MNKPLKGGTRTAANGWLQAGERTNTAGKPVRNKILLSLSGAEYQTIRPHLEFVELPQFLSLQEPWRRLRSAYFLNSGLASTVVTTHEGRTVEAGVVGYEGFVGGILAIGLDRSPLREVMQLEGDGFRVPAARLETIFEEMPSLSMTLSRYAVIKGMQVAQTAACNRLHEVSQRLARWLLMVQDRVHPGPFHITHDFLATMLGSDRPSVSIAAGALQGARTIRYNRGTVEILNRKRLEVASCSCYRVIQQLNGVLGLK